MNYKITKHDILATPYVENGNVTLQNEIIFGVIASPYIFFLTFIGLTVLNAIIVIAYKRIVYPISVHRFSHFKFKGVDYMKNLYYFLYALMLGIVSFFTGEIVTFVMLGFIIIVLQNINTTLKQILANSKEKTD